MKQLLQYEFDYRVKQTTNQTKKHFSQLDKEERQLLASIVKSIRTQSNNLHLSNHTKNHIPFFSLKLASQVLESCYIIEFNLTTKQGIESPRVLLRSKKVLPIIVEGKVENANVCMVVDIKSNQIITAYLNTCTDKHTTLNLDRYTDDLDIKKIIHKLSN